MGLQRGTRAVGKAAKGVGIGVVGFTGVFRGKKFFSARGGFLGTGGGGSGTETRDRTRGVSRFGRSW